MDISYNTQRIRVFLTHEDLPFFFPVLCVQLFLQPGLEYLREEASLGVRVIAQNDRFTGRFCC
jgi:hypothetical protein